MANKQKRDRFVVNVDGVLREAFSVQEQGKDLRFMPKVAKNLRVNEKRGQILRRYISIHRSENAESLATTIVDHIFLKEGKINNASMIVAGEKELFWPVISRLSPDMRHSAFDVKAREKDNIFNVGAYSPDKQTLLIIIVICGLKVNHEIFDMSMFRKVVVDYSYFRLICLAGAISLPSSSRGEFVSLQTASPLSIGPAPQFPILPGSPLPPIRCENLNPLTPQEWPSFVATLGLTLANAKFHDHIAVLNKIGIPYDEYNIRQLSGYLSQA